MKLQRDALVHPQVVALLEEHLQDMRSQSPPESCHALDLDRLRAPDIRFWTAWDGETLLACGALKLHDRSLGELKSMRTPRALRGRGAGKVMLQHLVAQACAHGLERLSLETGPQAGFAAARALYAQDGFTPCGPFADYRDDPYSVFMTRDLRHAPLHTVSAVVLREAPSGPEVLLVRKRGSQRLIHPGGKPLADEAPQDTLQRELLEELGVEMLATEGANPWLGSFEADAVHEPGRRVRSRVAWCRLAGPPRPCGEIEALVWLPLRPPYPPEVAPLSALHILPAVLRALP